MASRLLTLRFPMNREAPPVLVGLADVLGIIETAGIEWWMTDCDAVGGEDSSVGLIERRLVADGGLWFSDDELSVLAANLHQTIDCEIFGFIAGEDRGEVVVMLEAFDSSEWTVVVDEERVRVRWDSPLLALQDVRGGIR